MQADVAGELLSVVETALEVFRTLNDAEASQQNTPTIWSKNDIHGHRLDSAVNNHHRFVRAQQVEELIFPAYDQPHWVSSQGYQERAWLELVDLWRHYNRHLAHVINLIPAETLSVVCVIGSNDPVTLSYLVEDYLVHMKQHLDELGAS